ncbi:MAG: hypothetical protein QM734_11610 [Cyclobacteriaceae bacterium]
MLTINLSEFFSKVGYRTERYFIDLGLIQSTWNSSYVPYSRGAVRYVDDNPVSPNG